MPKVKDCDQHGTIHPLRGVSCRSSTVRSEPRDRKGYAPTIFSRRPHLDEVLPKINGFKKTTLHSTNVKWNSGMNLTEKLDKIYFSYENQEIQDKIGHLRAVLQTAKEFKRTTAVKEIESVLKRWESIHDFHTVCDNLHAKLKTGTPEEIQKLTRCTYILSKKVNDWLLQIEELHSKYPALFSSGKLKHKSRRKSRQRR